MYSYNFIGRHVALLYGAAALLVIAPLPYWIELVFGYKAQHDNAVVIFACVGIVLALTSIWSDFHDRHLFNTIEINGDGIKTYQKEGEIFISWSEIVGLENLKYIDTERKLAWGLKGVRILGKNNQKVLVFSTIRDYWGLLKLIESNTKMTLE